MKPITLSVCLFILIFVSCKSKEEKAAELIKGELFKTLVDFSSYEPVETVVDSAFTSIYRDSTILDYGYLLKRLKDRSNEYIDKANEARSNMEITSDSYLYYQDSKYRFAKEDFDTNLEYAKISLSRMNEISDSIKLRAKGFPNSFCGWQVKHKFRSRNREGNYDLANYIYYTDPKIKKIIYSEDTEDEELKSIRDLIIEAIE